MINWMMGLSLPALYLLLAACGLVAWSGVLVLLRIATQPGSLLLSVRRLAWAWGAWRTPVAVPAWRRYLHRGRHHKRRQRW